MTDNSFVEPHPMDLPKLKIADTTGPAAPLSLDLGRIKTPNDVIDTENDLWLGENVTQDMLDAVEPKLWYVVVKQVGIRERSAGGILYTDQTVADMEWTMGLCVVCKLGPAVYTGPKFQDLGLTPADGPQVGDVYRFQARNPTRYRLYGETFIEVADDALTSKFNRKHLHEVSFNR